MRFQSKTDHITFLLTNHDFLIKFPKLVTRESIWQISKDPLVEF